ncbi:metal-independent phosphoserine phosphatase-like [Carex rostrata]
MGDSSENLTRLRNNYWVLRHGRSIPNERGLIVSSLENGSRQEYGLAAFGIEQAKLAGELFKKELEERNFRIDRVRICYSPFSRTTETAREVARVLGISFDSSSCKEMVDLRERYFGKLDLLVHDKNAGVWPVWALDENNPFMPPEGSGESVADVASRLMAALLTTETAFEGCAVLIVSHGDTLQILQTMLQKLKENPSSNEDTKPRIKNLIVHTVLSQHRKFKLPTGELRPACGGGEGDENEKSPLLHGT